MKKVLVLRADDQSSEFAAALAMHKLEAICAPVIEILPLENWTAIDAALIGIAQIDALVFTSANGVRYFVERMSRVGRTCDDLPAGFGLGKKTQATMIDCGLNLLPTDPALDASALASEICSFMTSAGFDGVTGMRFLFPCGDKARTELPDALHAHGAIVDSIVVYRNVPVAHASVANVQVLLDQHAMSAVAFFSPSQVDAFATLFPDYEALLVDHVVIAAIGNTTANALREAGIAPSVIASSPESATLADEIASAISSLQRSA